MSGDGLVKPVNAPEGGQSSLGIQAGTSQNVILARVVLVSGAGGEILIYNGTPGPGTLIGSWTPAAGTDPFTNPTQKDLTVYAGVNSGYINVTSTGGDFGNTAILFHPGFTSHVTDQPQVYGASIQSGLVNEQEYLNVSSGAAGGNDEAIFQAISASADNTGGAFFNISIGAVTIAQWFKTQWNISVPIKCTLGTVSNPTVITTDAWNLLTLDAGWSTLAGQTPPQYRLNSDNTVEMIGAAQFSAAFTSQNMCSGANVLPAAYRPTNQQYIAPGPGAAGLQVSSNGNLLATQVAATAFCNFNGSIKLGI